MNDATPSPDPAAPPAGPAVPPPKPIRDFPAFFDALGNPLRWQLVKLMVTGGPLSASAAAEAVQREFDGVSKHLRVLRKAGVIASRAGQDRRYELYHIPDHVRRADGVLDYGFCVIRVT
jgi:DNA-binding transcriptional ArsR family regulator